jgi:hypothetical protein
LQVTEEQLREGGADLMLSKPYRMEETEAVLARAAQMLAEGRR